MNKRWFMSYVQSWRSGRVQYGYAVYEGTEHPVEKAARWTLEYGAKVKGNDQYIVVVLSFCEVWSEVPEIDVLSYSDM